MRDGYGRIKINCLRDESFEAIIVFCRLVSIVSFLFIFNGWGIFVRYG